MNGFIYLALGALFIVWPGSVQTIFMDVPFVGRESTLFRVVGMAVAVIGWLYLFGGRSGARQFGPASVLDRVVLVPAVLVPLVIAGIFPHTLGASAILDPALGIGAWVLHYRKTWLQRRAQSRRSAASTRTDASTFTAFDRNSSMKRMMTTPIEATMNATGLTNQVSPASAK